MTANNRRFLPLLCAFALLCLGVRGAGADPTAAYLQIRWGLSRPPLGAPLLPGAQQNPSAYRGQVFELTATVGGVVSAGADRTALLSVGAASLTARMPPSLQTAAWLQSGQTIRALLRVDPDGGDALSGLSLLAAAPEAEVALWESRSPAQPQASPRRPSYPSRSLGYAPRRPGTGTVPNTSPLPPGAGPIAPLPPRALAIYAPYRNAIRGMNRRLSDRDVDKITTSVLYFSDRYDLDPRLVVAMIIAESSFDVNSTSRTGAMGLGQLMPGTARGLGVTNAYDPVQNIAASVHILRGNLDQYGGAPVGAGVIPFDRIALTMAAYNAGSGAVRKYHGVPPYRETKRYVAKVTALYKKMCGIG